MYGYIYMTTNVINNKKYIGCHKSEVFTDKYKGSGTILLKAIDKYGWDNFKVELLEECSTAEDLIEKEEYYIKVYDAVNSTDFYNLTYSGYNRGLTGYKHTEESKQKISESLSGENNPFYNKGYLLSGENNPFYGKQHSKDTRKKMSENHADFKGENNPNYGKRGELSPLYGKHHSEETKQKIKESNIGKIVSDETRKRISESKKGKKLSNKTK